MLSSATDHDRPPAINLMQPRAVTKGALEWDSNRVLYIIKLMVLFKAKRLMIDQLLQSQVIVFENR